MRRGFKVHLTLSNNITPFHSKSVTSLFKKCDPPTLNRGQIRSFGGATAAAPSLSPAVRHLLLQHHLDASTIKGTGPKGRILKGDVLHFLSNPQKAQVIPPSQPVSPTSQVKSETKASLKSQENVQQVFASPSLGSFAKTPHYYFSANINAEEILQLQTLFKEREKLDVTISSFIAKAVGQALLEIADANVFFDPKSESLKRYSTVNIGVITSGNGKTVYPVIPSAGFQSVGTIASIINNSIEGAKKGEDYPNTHGATFTVFHTNSTESIGIIPPFQTGTVAIGDPIPTPIIKNGELTVSSTVVVSLSVDPRAVDEFTAAQLLEAIRKYATNPRAFM